MAFQKEPFIPDFPPGTEVTAENMNKQFGPIRETRDTLEGLMQDLDQFELEQVIITLEDGTRRRAIILAAETGEAEALASVETRSIRPSVSGDTLVFTSGYVDNNVPEIGGDPLTDDPAPSIAITGSPFYGWIKIEWTPGSYSTGGTPDFVPYGGTLVTPVVISGGTSIPSNVTPTVNATTGASTLTGKFYLEIATVSGSSGAYVLDAERSGNRTIIICGEESIRCVWDSP